MLRRSSRLSVLVLALILMESVSAHAGVLAQGSTVEGKTIAEWTGEWWNWLVKEPFETNAQADPTGEHANRNQSGPVFFVAGSFGGPVERTFTVPTGKYLLVPMIPYVFWAPEDGADEAAIRALAASNVDAIESPYFELDGVLLADPKSYREASPPGGFTLSDSPLLRQLGLPAMDRLAVADGYWAMLEPLTAGEHTIRFGGMQPGQPDTDGVLHITAVPEPGTFALLGVLGGIWFIRRKRSR